jgi:integrase/recombinase XerD
MAGLRVVEGAAAPSTGVALLVDQYLAAARARGLSPRTWKQAYAWPLTRVLVPYCEKSGIATLEQLDRLALDRLAGDLMETGGVSGRPLSRSSVATYIRTINVFLAWARAEGETVAAKAQVPKVARRVLEVLSRDEIDRMEDAAATERDKLIVRLLADTGIRLGELTKLTIRDVLAEGRQQFIKVTGKGRRERKVPVPPELYRRLTRYIQRGRPQDTSSDRIFVGLRRQVRGGDYTPLTDSGVEQMIGFLAEKAGIGRRVYPHLFRHSWVTFMLQRRTDPIILAQMAGHNSLTMIQQVYSHLNAGDAYEAMMRAYNTESD